MINRNENTYHSSLILFFLGLVGFTFKLLFNAFLARHLSSALFGDFSVALSVFNIISAYMLFGTATSSLRFFSGYLKKSQHDVAEKYLRWNLRIVFISSFVFLILLAIFTIVILGLHIFHLHDIREYHLVIYFLWLAPIGALSLLLTTYLLCDRNIYLGTFFGSAGFYFFGFLLLIPAVYIFNIRLHSDGLWLLMCCIMVTAVIIQLLILLLRMRVLFANSLSKLFDRTPSDKTHEKEWWRVSIKLIFNQLIFLIVTALDLLLLKIIDPSKEAVGCYAVAMTIAGIIWITQQSIFQFISPQISSLIESSDGKHQLQHLIKRTQLINIALNLLLIVIIILLTDPILKFFGPDYFAAKDVLWILLLSSFVAVLSTGAPKLLAYSGNENSLLKISICQILVMLIAGPFLIYFYGTIGAALTALLTWIVRTIFSIYFVRKKLRIKAGVWV